jgi:putative redox protein
MKITTRWNEKMTFTAGDGTHAVQMDTRSPIGSDSALSPKQLVLAGLAGCTAMDVVALLKKHQQPLEAFDVETEVEKTSAGYPEVFSSALLTFKITGQVDPARAIEAVELSQTKYCGVSAMLSKAFPIRYVIELNGQRIGEGSASF